METATLQVGTLSVLHVEDDPDFFALTREILAPAGISLIRAEDLATARRLMAQNKFDLMLLDHGMPDGNGLSFIEEVWWSFPDVPIIVISGRADEALAISCIGQGALNFILKDHIHRDLIPSIEQVLGNKGSWMYRQIATDHLTPWLEPYHAPVDHSKGNRFLSRIMRKGSQVPEPMSCN